MIEPSIGDDVDRTQELRSLIRILQRMPYVCVLAAAFIVSPSWITRHHVPVPLLAIAAAIALGGVLADIWFRMHPDSMSALFLMNSASALFCMNGFMIAMWEFRLFSTLGWLYTQYLFLYVAIFVIICIGMSLVWIRPGGKLREMYQELQTYLPGGVIEDYRLLRWMWPHKYSIAARLRGVGGFAVAVTALAAGLGGQGAMGYILFILFLLLAPTISSIVFARYWARRKYLRGQDLRIVWTRTIY